MDNNKIEDIYEFTSIEKINIPNAVYRGKNVEEGKTYQDLRDYLNLANIEFFTITAMIGKYIVGERKEIGNNTSFINYTDNKNKDEMTILKALAIDEVDNVYILKDYIAMRQIWQEYSYSGFEELYSWYSDNSINFEVKFAEEIVKAFDMNKEIMDCYD